MYDGGLESDLAGAKCTDTRTYVDNATSRDLHWVTGGATGEAGRHAQVMRVLYIKEGDVEEDEDEVRSAEPIVS